MSLFQAVPTGMLLTSGVNSALTWTNAVSVSSMNVSSLGANSLSVSTLTTSTSVTAASLAASTLTVSSITANSVGYSTLSGSTINATRLNYSSIVGSSISSNSMTLSLTAVSTQNTQIYQVATTNPTTSYTAIQASHVSTGTTYNALVINPSGGNVGVGTTAPGAKLDVSRNIRIFANQDAVPTLLFNSNPATFSDAYITGEDNGSYGHNIGFYTSASAAAATKRMTILGSGNVGIGTTAPSTFLHVKGFTGYSVAGQVAIFESAISIANKEERLIISLNNNDSTGGSSVGSYSAIQSVMNNVANTVLALNPSGGNVGINTTTPSATLQVNGSLAKSSGTFDIAHPLHPDTNKRLVHSFIEGPRCDLIYRGKTTLVDGSAVVNIDKECTHSPECAMDDGTFEALCDNPQVFLQNNKTFDRVRGVVTGATLTITCESQAAVEIEWMVIAERADPFIKQWDRTNPDGYLITQYGDASVCFTNTPLSGVEAVPPPSSGA